MSDEHIRRLLKRVTAELATTRQRLRQLESERREPIAIVGMACRYPGGVASPEDLWDLVVQERDAIGPFPTDRGWDVDTLAGAFPRCAGFLHDAGHFDAPFFNLSPRTALATDPQQRLLLETAWETFERSMIDPTALRGSRTGVFIGLVGTDYGPRLHEASQELEGHLLAGTFHSVASGRIAYTFGLEGPAITIDTACSSSLVALHTACRSLRSGETELALAGGAAVMSQPGLFVDFGRQRGLAADGRCKAFAEAADGTNWAEGVGLLLLERLRDARENGHRVLAVIRGSATNQDGASTGMSAPNGGAQRAVIRAALADAGLTSAEVDLVEAHETGTTLGDPVEAHALLDTYGQGRPAGDPVWLGTLKSNIGHAAAAAGVGGVIKTVMAMRHGVMPASLHGDPVSSKIDWDAGEVRLLTGSRPWPEKGGVRRAGVSAFGISGTNAHMILETAAEEEADADRAGSRPAAVPWLLSAKSPQALRAQAVRLRAVVDSGDDPDAPGVSSAPSVSNAPDCRDVGVSLATTRAHLRERAVLIGAEDRDLARGLARFADGELPENLVRGTANVDGGVVFVFPGQGSQWNGMANELMDTSPVFRHRMNQCAEALAPWLGWSPMDVLRAGVETGEDGRTDVVQPLLWAVMVSLAELWRHHGVIPDAVVGHSQGEVAAACVAGLLSLDEAARIVVERSRVVGTLPASGGMVSISSSGSDAEIEVGAEAGAEAVDAEAEVRARLTRWHGAISVAAVNSPRRVVVAGDAEALGELVAACGDDGLTARWVGVSYASHCRHVEAVRDELVAGLAGVAPAAPRQTEIPLMSTVNREWIGGRRAQGPALDPEYWYTNLRQPVQFLPAIEALAEEGFRAFIEVSPHPVLVPSVRETLERLGEETAQSSVVVGSLRRERGGPVRMLTSLAEAHVRGVDVRWQTLFADSGARPVDLPTYPFQRQRFWLETPTAPSRPDAHRWRLRESWTPLAPTPKRAREAPWLVAVPVALADDARVAAVVAVLGPDVVRWDIDLSDIDDASLAERLTRAAAGDNGRVAAGMVSLLALDDSGGESDAAAVLAPSLALVRAWGRSGVSARLWCVTSGAVQADAGDSYLRPAQGALWGVGRTAALEYPARWGGLIDLPEHVDERVLAQLPAILAGTEDQVALRPSGAFGRRLRRPRRPERPGDPWRARGTVLITGGTGGIGAPLASWVVSRGARHVVLASRRGPAAPGVAALVARLADLGAAVTVAACDVGDREALRRLLERIPAEHPEHPLSAVFHAAGTLTDDTPIEALTSAEWDPHLRGKARAAWYLHELTAHLPLGAFVLFSSGVSSWGAAGQAGYAAANAFLDSLAQYRRARGLPATSVSWGAWGEAGMAQDDRTRRHLVRHGVLPMPPAAAIAALAEILEDGESTATVAQLDWRRFAASFTAERRGPLFTQLSEFRAEVMDEFTEAEQPPGTAPTPTPVPAPGVGAAAQSPLAQRLAGLADQERRRVLLELVRAESATILGHATPAAVDDGTTFRDAGLDSVTAVDLCDRLRATTGLPLPATIVFNNPTPRQLAKNLDDRLRGTGAVPVAPVVSSVEDDPIAIAAMACRFPGQVNSPEQFWDSLLAGRDVPRQFPPDRGWDLESLGALTDGGAFLDDIAGFDAAFFGISPREALTMDPQQRLLLEVVWEALERATIDPLSLNGTPAGVFVGAGGQDYYPLAKAAMEQNLDSHALTGTATSVLSGRIAYVLGLGGPAVTVDTACSSSLTALHLAVQALRQGECELAVAAGVTLMATANLISDFARNWALARDGRCKAFSDDADGIGCAEGVGVVVLERLSRARRHAHPVLAVVRASAINQDGASNGLSAPNGTAQQQVIRRALANAGLGPTDVDLVEAHGTGTSLGDPIEAEALLATYGEKRPADRPLWLGSVKSNIGHTQAAAGIAGVIKTVLALTHRQMPRTLHVDRPSSRVDWRSGAVRLLTESRPWPETGQPRRAGVSSFGISGTNAHVILESVPAGTANPVQPEPSVQPDPPADAGSPGPRTWGAAGTVAWLVSAKTEPALRGYADRLAQSVAADPGRDVAAVAQSLLTTRSRFKERAVVVGRTMADFAAGLRSLAHGEFTAHVPRGTADLQGKTVFVFPGHGSQWPGMAVDLMASSPVFARQMEECGAALRACVSWSLADVLGTPADAAVWRREDVVQPVLWAVMVSLARVWRSYGVEPEAVVGHSLGEIAAATVAGALSLDQAAYVVAARGRAVQELPEPGSLVVVPQPRAEVEQRLRGWAGAVGLAATNSPRSVVLSGDPDTIEEVVADYARDGVTLRRVAIDYAAHSSQLDGAVEKFAASLSSVTPLAARVPLVSSVTGEWVDGASLDARYWHANLRRPVDFESAVRRLASEGFRCFIEVSAHPVLLTAIQETLESMAVQDEPCVVAGSLRRGDGDLDRMVTSLAEVYVRGVPVQWQRLLLDRAAATATGTGTGTGTTANCAPVRLPTYPFQPRRYWINPVADGGTTAGVTSVGPAETPAEDVTAGDASATSRASRASAASPRGIQELARCAPEERPAALLTVLARMLARALGTDVADVGVHEELWRLGLDSLITMQVRTMLTTELGVALPLVAFQEAPTVATLGERILPLLPEPDRGSSRPTEAAEDQPPTCAPDPTARYQPFELTDLQHAYVVGRSDALPLGQISTYFSTEVDLVGVDLARLTDAFQKTVERHDMLRAVITPDGRQRVLARVPWYEFATLDLQACDGAERDARLRQIRAEQRARVPDPTTWPLFDIRVSKLAPGRIRLHISYELLIADGWSAAVWFHDWAAYYRGETARLEPIEITFRDFVAYLEERRKAPGRARALEYWRSRARTLPPGPQLPLAKDPSTVAKPEFVRRSGRLDVAEWARFQQYAAAAGVTASAALCAAYAQVIAGWSTSDRFTLTVVAYHRPPVHPHIRSVVGSFTTTVLLEVDSTLTDRFAHRAERIQRQLWSDLEHVEVSGVQALREINRGRPDAERVVMPVVFASTVNFSAQKGEAGASGAMRQLMSMGESAEVVSSALRTPQVWLDHQLIEEDGALAFNWDTVDALFPGTMISDMFAAYRDLLRDLATDESDWHRPAALMVPPADLAVRHAANATAGPVPSELLHDPFIRCARENPQRCAVVAGDRVLTYGELDRISNRFGHALRDHGVGVGALVGVVMDKGWEQVAACLAVLKAGAAYVPIDAAVPARRLAQLVDGAGIRVALTQPWRESTLCWPEHLTVLPVDASTDASTDASAGSSAGSSSGDRHRDQPLVVATDPDQLAYVIYTSGSTGVPKGVMIEHRSARNTICDVNERFGVTERDRVLGLSALNFDLSVYDIFGVLSVGGALVLPEPQAHREPARWAALIAEHEITIWNTVPKLMEMLVEHASTGAVALPLRIVMLSGDWIPVTLPDRVRALAPKAQIWSLGGATEAAIWSIWHRIGEVDQRQPSIPYGTPMRNQRFHVLNRAMQPCPTWVTGNLYIAGLGLARGYLGDEMKTRASFGRHPVTGERLYATGDLGRYLPDGEIEFLGRADHQVKIHGYRIELGEVEAALLRCQGVREAAATVTGGRHDGRLVAYVALDDDHGADHGADGEDVREALSRQVPEYLIPSQIVVLDRLPLSANGKLDRAALPVPRPRADALAESVPARDEIEEELVRIWGEFFGADTFGITTSFFDLGGDSLLGVRLMARITAATGRVLPVSTLFRRPTIELLADALRDLRPPARREALVPIQVPSRVPVQVPVRAPVRADGARRPLYLVHPVGGDVLCYAELAKLLGEEQPVYGLQVPDRDVPFSTVEEMAAHYADAVTAAGSGLRSGPGSGRGSGPYRLGGWSMGGVLALEMGRQLTARGAEVEIVAIIDLVEPPGPAAVTTDETTLLTWFARDIAGLVGSDWVPAVDAFQPSQERTALRAFYEGAVEASVLPSDLDFSTLEQIVSRFSANTRALLAHEPRPYPGRVRFFRGRDGAVPDTTIHAWCRLFTGDADVVDVPGDHYTMMREPHIEVVAANLRELL